MEKTIEEYKLENKELRRALDKAIESADNWYYTCADIDEAPNLEVERKLAETESL